MSGEYSVDRLAASSEPAERKCIKEALARMTFGGNEVFDAYHRAINPRLRR